MTGIRSALGPALGREAAPVRSALLGSVIAVMVVTASLTFGSSLSFLVSHPSLYGWNWDYALLAGFSAAENLPAAQTASLLDHDPAVAHWTGVYFETIELDGQAVPVLASSPDAPVSPPLLSGHGLQAAAQVVLGPATLAQLHKHVGDTVIASTGQGRRSACASWARPRCPPSGAREPIAADGHGRDRRHRPFPGPGPQPAGNSRAGPDGRVHHACGPA